MSNENFDYTAVPHGFAHCFNSDCPLGEDCLRRLAAIHVPAERLTLNCVCPSVYPKAGTDCPCRMNAEQVRLAWGWTGVYDELPHSKAVTLKRLLIAHFTHSGYYRIYRQERPLTPADREQVAAIFRRLGLQPPTYSRYTMAYNWHEKS